MKKGFIYVEQLRLCGCQLDFYFLNILVIILCDEQGAVRPSGLLQLYFFFFFQLEIR